MSEAIKIINEAYHRTGGKGEYMGLLYTEKTTSPNGIRDMIGINGRKRIRIKTSNLDIIVFEYRETGNELLVEALIEHYLNIIIKMCKKYLNKASSIKYKRTGTTGCSYVYDDDMLNESFIVLNKCIWNYRNNYERASFTSYFLGELRNHMIETCRRRYFNTVKIPIAVYKNFRRYILNVENADNILPANQLGMTQRVNQCISENIESIDYNEMDRFYEGSYSRFFDRLDDEKMGLLNILEKYLKNKEDVIIFCLVYGIFCEKEKSADIADSMGLSKPAISKRLKRIKRDLRNASEIQTMYKYYKDKNIF